MMQGKGAVEFPLREENPSLFIVTSRGTEVESATGQGEDDEEVDWIPTHR